MVEQLTLFPEPPAADLEVIEMSFIGKSYTSVEELFRGFNHLYAITFSYGLGFIQKIIQYFDTAQIILGCEAMVKFDLQTVMAFQTRSLEEIKKHKQLIERVNNGTLSFWVAKEILSHQKVFILTSDSGKTRIIWGSANFSSKSFSGNQRENIGYFENSNAAFNYFMDEFETLKEFSTNEVVRESLFVQSGAESEELENVPVVKEIKVKDTGIILEANEEAEQAAEFVYDIQGLAAKYAPLVPRLENDGNKVLITPKKVHELIRKHRIKTEELKVKRSINPQFSINYETGLFSFNGKQYSFDQTMDQVKSDLLQINEYFSGFDIFIGDVDQLKSVYFRVMNYIFLSPFIAKLRHEASKTKNFPVSMFPMYAILHGPKSAGKSAFVDTMQHIMFGKALGGQAPNTFTKSNIWGAIHELVGVPTHIEDLGRKRFNEHADELIKFDNNIIEEHLTNHPVFVITTNDIESLKKELAKRMYYATVDAQLNNVNATINHKKMNHFRKKITTAFYQEYLKRMYPKVMVLIKEMNEFEFNKENEEWIPDIYQISSRTIIEIYNDCGIEVPPYVSEVMYSNYFQHNDLTEKMRQKIIFEWTHNRSAFKVMRKKNLLEYIAGEKPYEAMRISDALPEELRSKPSGVKVVMWLDEAEKFFGIHFKKGLF